MVGWQRGPVKRPPRMPTITIANFPARMERLWPPRWVHVRFPRGAMFGEPGNHAKQRAVLEATLPHRWEALPVRWAGREIVEGP